MKKLFLATYLWILLLPVSTHIVGAASNDLVEFANGGRFPVMMSAAEAGQRADANGMLDKTHCVMTSKTHLNLLADVIDRNDAVMSVGDLILYLSVWLASICPFMWGALVIKDLIDLKHDA